jgi:hypothetical protein
MFVVIYLSLFELKNKMKFNLISSFFGDFPVAKIYWMRDNEALISKEEQISQTLVEMLDFLQTF